MPDSHWAAWNTKTGDRRARASWVVITDPARAQADCAALDDADAAAFRAVLAACAPWYHNGSLGACMPPRTMPLTDIHPAAPWRDRCTARGVPAECVGDDWGVPYDVFDSFHSLLDWRFLNPAFAPTTTAAAASASASGGDDDAGGGGGDAGGGDHSAYSRLRHAQLKPVTQRSKDGDYGASIRNDAAYK